MNKIKDLLIKYKISNKNSFSKYSNNVRDRKDIGTLRCNKSGVIILSTTDHMNIDHYSKKAQFKYFKNVSRKKAISYESDDLKRRFKFLKNNLKNKNYLDFGTGSGGMLEYTKDITKNSYGIEPNKIMLKSMLKSKLNVFESLSSIDKSIKFDVISLFHVYEHLIHPINVMNELKSFSKKSTLFYIEVPHANDFLLSVLNIEKFKKYTLWSEHIILHTKKSIKIFLEKSGFKILKLHDIQRYDFFNHLYWISKGMPNGHKKFQNFDYKLIKEHYEKFLRKNEFTDTLIAVCKIK